MRAWRWIKAVAWFWVDFVVGDDPVVTGVLAGVLAATWGLVEAGVAGWWLLPLGVLGATLIGLRRAILREGG